MKKILGKYKYFLIFIFIYLVKAGVYFLINHAPLDRTVIHTAIDDAIPFVPFFVLFYVSWFVYVPGWALLTSIKDKKVFFRTSGLLFAGIAAGLIIFVLFPSKLSGRPEPGGGFFGWILSLIYAADDPANVFPSLHCYEALIVHFSVFYKSPWTKKYNLRILSALLCALICASTVLIKQHAFPDLVAGVMMAVLFFGGYLSAEKLYTKK